MADPRALLLVFSEPGAKVSEEEYHDWYDNEHVPLRVNTPTFSSWARLRQIDSATPSYGAYYDLESYEATLVPPYSRLAETRSAREKDVLARLALLDRRIYEAYAYTGGVAVPPPPSPAFSPAAARYVVFVETDVAAEGEAEYNRWYDEEHVPLLARVPGWLRSRRFVLREETCWGTDEGLLGRRGRPPSYLTVHEWATQEKRESEAYRHAMSTPWRERVNALVAKRVRREFELYRAWASRE